MLVFVEAAARWQALQLNTKAALPIEDLVVVAGMISGDDSVVRQLTGIGGRVKPTSHRLLLVLPLPQHHSIQVLEVGEGAVQLLCDVKACFPSLVRKNPLAAPESDDDDGSESDDDSPKTKRPRQDEAQIHAEAQAQAAATIAPFLAATRVRVLPSMAALREAYAFDRNTLVTAIERSTESPSQYLCLEFPSHAPSISNELNFGVVVAHASAPSYLEISLLREPHNFFTDASLNDDKEPVVFQDATVFSFNSKREASEHGGGKTVAETVQNIRLRHASGTFCTLVHPTMTWADVVHKYSTALPQVRKLQGELRSRRFMGVVPNRIVEIRHETR